MQIHVNAFLISIIKSKKREKKNVRTGLDHTTTKTDTRRTNAVCYQRSITLITSVICQRLSRNVDFFAWAAKHIFLHTLFLENKTQIGEKKTGQCFTIELQFICNNSDKSEQNWKNNLKFDIGRLCSQPFSLLDDALL